MTIKFVGMREGVCDECKKTGKGVWFTLFNDPKNVCFLCLEHFRLNTDILLEAGILQRQPRIVTVLEPLDRWTLTEGDMEVGATTGRPETKRTKTKSYSYCSSVTRSRGESRSKGLAERGESN